MVVFESQYRETKMKITSQVEKREKGKRQGEKKDKKKGKEKIK